MTTPIVPLTLNLTSSVAANKPIFAQTYAEIMGWVGCHPGVVDRMGQLVHTLRKVQEEGRI
jgi:hypothetical protein